jgi:hypothetical protein
LPDPNKPDDLKSRFDGYQVHSWDQVEDMVHLYLEGADRDRLDPILDDCVAVYNNDLDEVIIRFNPFKKPKRHIRVNTSSPVRELLVNF